MKMFLFLALKTTIYMNFNNNLVRIKRRNYIKGGREGQIKIIGMVVEK